MAVRAYPQPTSRAKGQYLLADLTHPPPTTSAIVVDKHRFASVWWSLLTGWVDEIRRLVPSKAVGVRNLLARYNRVAVDAPSTGSIVSSERVLHSICSRWQQ